MNLTERKWWSAGADTDTGFLHCFRVKKHAIHSSDTTSSSDEERFERRKSKSMTRARNRWCRLLLSPAYTKRHVNLNIFSQLWKYHSEGLCVWCCSVYLIGSILCFCFRFVFTFFFILHGTRTIIFIFNWDPAVIFRLNLICAMRRPSLEQNITHLSVQ